MPPGGSLTRAVPTDLVKLIEDRPGVRAMCDALSQGRRIMAGGVAGSAWSLLSGAIARSMGRLVVAVVAHLDDAEDGEEELRASGVDVLHFPALETLPGETGVSPDLFAQRLRVARTLRRAPPGVLVAPIQALMQNLPPPEAIDALSRHLRKGCETRPGDLARWLAEAGYTRVQAVEDAGEFALRGGIMDIFPPGDATVPIRVEFLGDTVERILEVDPETLASDREIPEVELTPADASRMALGERGPCVVEILPPGAVAVLVETIEVEEQGRGYFERLRESRGITSPGEALGALHSRCAGVVECGQHMPRGAAIDAHVDLGARVLPAFPRDAGEAVALLADITAREGARALVLCRNDAETHRMSELIAQDAPGGAGIAAVEGVLSRGFILAGGNGALVLAPAHEVLSRFTMRRRAARPGTGRAGEAFVEIEPGDLVVHTDHGIARFVGLRVMTPREVPRRSQPGAARPEPEPEEYLTLEFAGGTLLHVPATEIERVHKYIGGFRGRPPLSVLGAGRWQAQKERVARGVRSLAAELLRVRAAREHLPGFAFPEDTAWQREFEAQFPYEETPDQIAALSEIKRDMGRPRPMDRLICGDVGFGKTELAIRAAFKAAEAGKQVSVLVPTTVLCEQHERTFRARFAGYPFRVEAISRLRPESEIRRTLDDLREGRVDVIIGTHRLLSEDVAFKDLGLVIIDEEQRFGVEHKETLLRLRLTADVLTLSATPIPRTLHMAMLGLRDISNLTTPPGDRRAVVTEVIPPDPVRIRQAIEREIAREGQVFYVHNRVHDIVEAAHQVQQLVPHARIVCGHGRMRPQELEEVMLRFITRRADVLVSTTIIESGIDIPSANTIIIEDADRFGLTELHQLRGRVGRSSHRAYCYLLLPRARPLTDIARRRLQAIEQYSMLGAGFRIAMRDLEIRGAGNLLGPEQSGHIAAVGYDLYCRLLEQAVRDLTRAGAPPTHPLPGTSVELGLGGMIPHTHIPSDRRRIEAYRRLFSAATREEQSVAVRALTDAYGAPPRAMRRLIDLAGIRLALAQHAVRTLTIRDRDLVFLTDDPRPIHELLSREPRNNVRVLPPEAPGRPSEVYLRPDAGILADADALPAYLRRVLGLGGGEEGPGRAGSHTLRATRGGASRRASRP
jgi:transcription-repair coupling factor (superfamily II helicase)